VGIGDWEHEMGVGDETWSRKITEERLRVKLDTGTVSGEAPLAAVCFGEVVVWACSCRSYMRLLMHRGQAGPKQTESSRWCCCCTVSVCPLMITPGLSSGVRAQQCLTFISRTENASCKLKDFLLLALTAIDGRNLRLSFRSIRRSWVSEKDVSVSGYSEGNATTMICVRDARAGSLCSLLPALLYQDRLFSAAYPNESTCTRR